MNEREIFERYAERVLQFFVNKVDSPSDANDLAQESFIRVFERLRRGDVRHPRAFLFGVAALVLKEHWKEFGRNFYLRYDFEQVTSEGAQAMMKVCVCVCECGQLVLLTALSAYASVMSPS